MAPKINSLDHLVLTVANIEKTLEFYVEVFGMRKESFGHVDGTNRHALCFGNQKFNLHQAGEEFEPKADKPTTGAIDLCLLTNDSLETWTEHLGHCGVQIEIGPIDRTGAQGPLRSIYIRDPDANLIEISNQK
ncbi:MAG: VOC family protein [Pseudomonadota bacterium]